MLVRALACFNSISSLIQAAFGWHEMKCSWFRMIEKERERDVLQKIKEIVLSTYRQCKTDVWSENIFSNGLRFDFWFFSLPQYSKFDARQTLMYQTLTLTPTLTHMREMKAKKKEEKINKQKCETTCFCLLWPAEIIIKLFGGGEGGLVGTT